jgi:hypothetical protein
MNDAVNVDSWGQTTIATHPGRRSDGIALHRATDKPTQDTNRNVSCPSSLTRPPGMECDEYPYASTLEGGASLGGYVRAMIPKTKNGAQGNALQTFYNENRILDRIDPFWVQINP